MKKKDCILVLALVIVAILSYCILNIVGKDSSEADEVIVSIDGKTYGTYSLNENREIVIDEKSGYNMINIKDGYVYMDDADCPDKYCVEQGRICKVGSTIVCLPHKLTVQIKSSLDDGGKDTHKDEPDVIAQ